VTGVAVATLPVVTRNVVEVKPCGTMTDAGMLAAVEFELESDTNAPPDPAADVRLTVPVPGWPLTMVLGLIETLPSAGATGFTVTPAVILIPA